VATFALTVALSWALGIVMHWWPHFPPRLRRLASLAASAAGIVFLVAATAAEGLREAETTSMVVLGPAYVTATASASASLHYYVLTAVCLLLGFAGLALGEPLSRWLSRHWILSAAAVAWLITIIRFLLERTASPSLLTQVVGVTWMAPVAGAWFATCLRDEDRPLSSVLGPLVAYAYLVRGFVFLVAVVATRWQLGTHYDVSPLVQVTLGFTGGVHTFESGSGLQLFWLSAVPQLLVWPLFTVASGLAGAALVWSRIPQPKPRRRPAPGAPDTLSSSRDAG
jgi:hypothetical protein